ncbi:MAG: hypothetical protein JO170_30610 [Verrucomicrobia bacterium]|nr:hypothetical protein [Verrucomicrobiota bacterium]
MKTSLLKTNRDLLVTLAALLFMPTLIRAATVIDHVPYKITGSGDYELDSDLTAAGTDGIEVDADNVVIDLKGHTLTFTQSQTKHFNGVLVLSAANVTLRNGTISGFVGGVVLEGPQNKAQDLQLLNNADFGAGMNGNDGVVINCYIIGTGTSGSSTGIVLSDNALGVQVRENQVSECSTAISSTSLGSGIIHNYVANSTLGLNLNGTDVYQGNVVTNCHTAFQGGKAIGQENGGD